MAEIPLIFPQLAPLYQTLAPFTETLLRIVVGLWMVPHGLRMSFGFFPTTGLPQRSVQMLAVDLDKWGYRPGWLWAPLISSTELIAGPMLALGLFTRAIA
jgi:putative oxidoreductase